MKHPRTKLLLGALIGVVAFALILKFVGTPMFVTWLRAHSTVQMLNSPPGGRYSVAVFRYPRLGDIPECLGFGQGYVQLYQPGTGKVLQEKVADDLALIGLFAWGASDVTISGFAKWETPGWYQARN